MVMQNEFLEKKRQMDFEIDLAQTKMSFYGLRSIN
jgi:hypothetical protein